MNTAVTRPSWLRSSRQSGPSAPAALVPWLLTPFFGAPHTPRSSSAFHPQSTYAHHSFFPLPAFQRENPFIFVSVVTWPSLKLAQFSPRRKHETVHRSSSWDVRI